MVADEPLSERQRNDFFSLSFDILCEVGPDGSFTRVNPACSALGYTPEDLRGTSFIELVHDDDRAVTVAAVDALRSSTKPTKFEAQLRCKDGSYRLWSWIASPSVSGSFQAVAHDITERKWVENELQASLSLVQETLESTTDGILVIDHENKIANFNRLFADTWKIPDQVMDSREGDEVIAFLSARTIDPVAFNAMIQALRAEPKASSGVIAFVDGRVFEYSCRPRWNAGRPAGRAWSFRDTTEHTRAERELREHLSMGLEHAVEGVTRVDALGRYISVNAVFARMNGYTEDEMVGMEWRPCIHADDHEALQVAYERMLATGKAEIEARGVRKDGAVCRLRMQIVSVKDDIGNSQGHHGFVTDITDQKRMQERLLVADRMASMGTLAAGVAHEINNPLAYVIANLTFLSDLLPDLIAERGEASVREVAELLHDMRDGTDRVRQIVRDLQIFSRPDEEDRGPVAVKRVMEFAINMAWHQIKHRARLIKHYDVVPTVGANEGLLGQLFLNLLVNAAQAIPEGNVDSNEIRVHVGLDVSGRIAVSVGDTGTGIPAALLLRIFDPFFTTKPVGMGTGLGLSVCHGILAKIGGEITVESEVGKGTIFRVLLPPAVTAERVPKDHAPQSTHPRGRVLIVDDEPMLATAISRILQTEHDAVVCTSCHDALEALRAGPPFDVIVCDLMMPVMTGMDLYDDLVRTSPELAKRMVFMTGGVFTVRAKEFLDRVPNPRIEKPLDFKTLRAFVRTMIV